MTILVDSLGEKASANDGALKRAERLDNRHIEQSILKAGMRSNKGVVAILRCIGTSDDKNVLLNLLAINIDNAVNRFVSCINLESSLHIVEGTTLGALGVTIGNIGIKAHACCAHKGVVVKGAVVAHLHIVAVDDLDGTTHIHWNLKVTRQSVA